MKKPELLAPAGNLEKLKIALAFGADAVYFGIPDFSLRARVNQFDLASIEEGARICRDKGKKFYVTLNIYAHNSHLEKLPEYFAFLKRIRPDGLIVSDPGIIQLAGQHVPEIPLHLSTQANATNIEAIKFWKTQGIRRVITARELTLDELRQCRQAVPDMELECFVHGAMCMSYSGRCILSRWMSGRSANLGDCSQPCRWKYQINDARQDTGDGMRALSEDLVISAQDDKGKYQLDVQEDRQGTYLFNSSDICLLEHLDELMVAGIDSFKIEGRAKSAYYLAAVTKSYRTVIDAIAAGTERTALQALVKAQMQELEKLSNRGYSKGFLLGNEPQHLFEKDTHKADWMFCGISDEQAETPTRAVTIHNYLHKGDQVEVITPTGRYTVVVSSICGHEGTEVVSAHGGGGKPYFITFSKPIKGVFLMRKQTSAPVS